MRAAVSASCSRPLGDVRYRRVDFASKLAHQARRRFVKNISKGEAFLDFASAALQICAEDDAIISNSPVEFPVGSYLRRLEGVSQTVTRALESHRIEDPHKTCALVEDVLFGQLKFRAPSFGDSNLPERSVVDHPGVWEDQKYAYLHELLISRTAIPALLVVLYQHVMKELLLAGSIDFVASFQWRDGRKLPKAIPVPGLHRQSVLHSDGSILNTCSSEVIVEVLRYLKRAFWPFAWNTNSSSHGGFQDGCRALLLGEESAEHEVISKCAKHRLSRGIWTTTGGGDILRALAACERLVLLCGEEHPLERRDLALLYFCLGDNASAFAEMKAFSKTPHFNQQGTIERELCRTLMHQFTPSSTSQALTSSTFLQRDSPRVDFEADTQLIW